MSRVSIKREVLLNLRSKNIDSVCRKIRVYENQQLISPLFIALCDICEQVKWNAVFVFGQVLADMAQNNVESARIVMRRFLWSLNDESGGIGWGVPEAMAEVMCQSPLLRKEYLHMLVSYMRQDGEEEFMDGNFLELPLLQRGLLWGVARLCFHNRQEMKNQNIVDDLLYYLNSPDPVVVGYALYCLSFFREDVPATSLEQQLNDPTVLRIFLDTEMVEVSVAELARKRSCL